jgi:hypothetical protein
MLAAPLPRGPSNLFRINSGDVKMAGIPGVVLSVAQVIHRFSDALDHKGTLEKALVQAAAAIKL